MSSPVLTSSASSRIYRRLHHRLRVWAKIKQKEISDNHIVVHDLGVKPSKFPCFPYTMGYVIAPDFVLLFTLHLSSQFSVLQSLGDRR